MGEPILQAEKIPVINDVSPVIDKKIEACGKEFLFTCVSIGKEIEVSPVFPERTNTEFVQLVSREHIKMRVWERGSGETLACGTGTCASVVACVLKGLTERKVKVDLLGGTLYIEWNEEDNHVYMTGPAEFSFDGEWLK